MLRTYNSYVFQNLVHMYSYIAIKLCTYMYSYLVYLVTHRRLAWCVAAINQTATMMANASVLCDSYAVHLST